MDFRETEIIDFIKKHPVSSSKEIHEGISIPVSYATVKRILTKLIAANMISINGQRKGARYIISSAFELLHQIEIEKYFEREIDERKIKEKQSTTF